MWFEGLAGLVIERARTCPDVAALRCGQDVSTYRELHVRSDGVAAALTGDGIEPGSRVAYLGRTAIAFFEVLFGTAKVGAVLVPVNWRLAAPEIAEVLADSGAELIVVDAEYAPVVGRMRERLPDLRRVVVSTPVGPDAYVEWRDGRREVPAVLRSAPDEVVLQIYTSGTTGRPKGVMSRNSAFPPYLRALGKAARIEASSVSLSTLPLFHIGGIGWALAGLAAGCLTVLERDAGADALLVAVERRRVTVMIAVPAVIQSLLDSPRIGTADVTSLATLYYGGGPITARLLDQALTTLRCDFVQGFGLTECPLVTVLAPAEHTPELLRSCGRAVPGAAIRIVDPETGDDVAAGVVGELWVRSPSTMAGYWRQAEATAATLVDGEWLRTGDAARVDDGGYVHMADRLKDMIVTGGENVYPAEVENVLTRHPAVAACAVIGVPSRRWTEAVVAVVVCSPGHVVGEHALIAFCRERLAGFKTPKAVVVVDELPRTPSGKVMKYVLKKELADIVDRPGARST
ncbi:long-chain-fatty-acid--CoA ligase [Pseudonocardia sp. GCM10023141]|uniref:long-chain-fatty-acid--CoA ligase n=1 Tax=Pseudonocardia sp. GCM10023141 TaxID=3252653 RepID=UPI003620C1D8